MEIISRADAVIVGHKRYFTGRPCSKGHTAQRYVSTGNCCDCQKAYSSTYAQSERSVFYRNFDQRKAELLHPGIHVPPEAHEEIYQYIDMVLSRYKRPPCPRPIVAATAPKPIDTRTEWERCYDIHAQRGGAAFGRYMANLGGTSETHSIGWVPAVPLDAPAPPRPEVTLGGSAPQYLSGL